MISSFTFEFLQGFINYIINKLINEDNINKDNIQYKKLTHKENSILCLHKGSLGKPRSQVPAYSSSKTHHLETLK